MYYPAMRVLHAFALRQVLADVLPELRLPRHVRVLVLPLRHRRGDGLAGRCAVLSAVIAQNADALSLRRFKHSTL